MSQGWGASAQTPRGPSGAALALCAPVRPHAGLGCSPPGPVMDTAGATASAVILGEPMGGGAQEAAFGAWHPRQPWRSRLGPREALLSSPAAWGLSARQQPACECREERHHRWSRPAMPGSGEVGVPVRPWGAGGTGSWLLRRAGALWPGGTCWGRLCAAEVARARVRVARTHTSAGGGLPWSQQRGRRPRALPGTDSSGAGVGPGPCWQLLAPRSWPFVRAWDHRW